MNDFDGFGFTQRFGDLLFQGCLDDARALLQAASALPVSDQHRIDRARTLLQDVQGLDRGMVGRDVQKLVLRPFPGGPATPVSGDADVISMGPGLYRTGQDQTAPSRFDEDFRDAGDQIRRALKSVGFDAPLDPERIQRIRVITDARFCTEHRNLYTCVSGDGCYDRAASSRVAKVSAINYLRPQREVIDRALVLPAPHHVRNYYHAMSEMACFLRYAAATDDPVIYSEDCFGILPVLADVLGISRDRLIAYDKVRHVAVRLAAQPVPGAFYWTRDMFRQFRRMTPDAGWTGLKLYVSRTMSSRSPGNEAEVERALVSRGFLAIHPEMLPVAVQANLFSAAGMIVAPHGAGLTNIVFSRPGTRLVELFHETYVVRDFYLRSRHNDMPYAALIHGQDVDIDQLIAVTGSI